jgi:hypothetical protein
MCAVMPPRQLSSKSTDHLANNEALLPAPRSSG